MNLILEKAKNVIDIEIQGLQRVKEQLNADFEKLVTACKTSLDNGGKIIITGVGKSGHIGHKIASTLASTGSHATFLHPVEAMHGDLGIMQRNDILLALSYSGETEELLTILPSAKRLDVPIVAITGYTDSKLAKYADIVIAMPIHKEACPFNLAPTTSTTALLVIGDALAMTLLDQRGFTKEDFGYLHPGGAIGRAITLRVSDIMRSEQTHQLVMVGPNTTVKDTILQMTGARSGSAIVIDENKAMLGIFTDGDFRRCSCNVSTILEKPVSEYMTKNPISIYSDQLAVSVLKLIETKKIDDIVVVDRKGRAIGLVDSQDLPGFKLM